MNNLKSICCAKRIILFTILIFLAAFSYMYDKKATMLNRPEHPSNMGFLLKTPKCNIPDIDPFDESIKPFIKPVGPVVCSNQHPLTYVERIESNSTFPMYKLLVNSTVISEYSSDINIQCCYSEITRYTIPAHRKADRSSDNMYNTTRCKFFNMEVTLPNETEFLLVKCFKNKTTLNEVYKNMHSVVPVKDKVKQKFENVAEDNEERLNVLLLGIDSMSRLNMLRTMSRTVKFLKEQNWVELQSHNKVGSNTLPNIIAVLTGYKINNLVKNKICSPYTAECDGCPFLWKNFSADGYVTMYAEDRPAIGTFNYNKPGFKNPPTDYYFRPYMLAAEKFLPAALNKRCLGPQSTTDHMLNYLQTFLNVFRNSPFFAHVWLNNFSHDDINIPAATDQRFENFFQTLHDSEIINKSMIVFFGDHGMRFGKVRETYVGWLEDNLPFIYFWIPLWFREKYPHAYHNLRANGRRLTTHFDIHATLKSVIDRSYALSNDSYIRNPTRCKSCVSLFSQVTGDRSCDDVGIESEFCSCSQYENASVVSEHVRSAASDAVSTINELLRYSETSQDTNCAVLNLSQVLNAKKKINGAKQKHSFEEYFIVFKTTPGEAIFETSTRYYRQSKLNKIVGAINRINSYGTQSECVRGSELKPYCFCVQR